MCGSVWQRSFYDHIIREDEDLDAIRLYIQENPKRLHVALQYLYE